MLASYSIGPKDSCFKCQNIICCRMLAKIKANILPEIACFIGSKYLLMIHLAPNIILGACFKQACTLYKLNAEISKNGKVRSCESNN